MKKLLSLFLSLIVLSTLISCGKKADPLEGKSLNEILDTVYENADLDPELRDAMTYYETYEITEENAEYVIGTAEIAYDEAICSAPMMSAVAYQCILLRVPADADVSAAKELILQNSDPRKWICVEAESTAVENVGNVILYIMADTATTEAVKTAFLALGK